MSRAESPAMPWLAVPLAAALEAPPAHALLVHGPSGIGQFEFAAALAHAWLCEDSSRPIAERPCNVCVGCKLVRARTHPDLLMLIPQALREEFGASAGTGEEGGSGETGESGSRKKPSRDIRVDDVRAANAFASTTASRGRMKVVVIHPAERMNPIAANAFLKTLEEPPGDSRFVLSTADSDRLLPTIRSRCRAIALKLPARSDAIAWLQAHGVADAEMQLAAAGGRPGDAVARAAMGIDAGAWRALPKRLLDGDVQAFAGWPLPWVLDALHKLCDDAIRVASGMPPRYFAAAELPQRASIDGLVAWSKALVAEARTIEHPWHPGLAVDALVQRARQALQMPRSAAAGRTPSG